MKQVFVVLVALLVALPAWAANGRLQVDPQELAVGQTGRVVVYLTGGRVRGAPTLDVPDGLEARFYSSSQRYDSFTRTLLIAYEYRLTALREGSYTVGPVELALTDGSIVQTNAVAVTVMPRSEVQGAPIEVSAGFTDTEAWEGQVVVYRYRMVANVPIIGVEWRFPGFEGLRTPQRGTPEEKSYFIDNADGQRTSIVEGAIPLIATGTGRRDQNAALAQVRIPRGRADLLGFRQYQTETVPSEAASLRVRPLPPAPADFSGLVGDFQFTLSLQSQRAAVGDSVGWKLQVRGGGAIEGWRPPEVVVDGGSVYSNAQEVGAQVQDGRYVGWGTFERVLVPTREGTLQLPPLRIVTFSPSRGEYVTHEIVAPPLTVSAGREQTAELESFAGALPESAGGELVAVDFRDVYSRGPDRVWRIGGLLSALTAVAAAPGFLVVFGALGDRARRWWAARQEARRPETTPADLLANLPPERMERLAALDGALQLALARRGGVRVTELDRAAIVAELEEGFGERVTRLGALLDRARFGFHPVDVDQVEEEVRAVISDLEARR